MFDPKTGLVKMVADGFSVPNGIALGPGGTVAYVYVVKHSFITPAVLMNRRGDSAGIETPTLPSTVYVT